MDVARTHIGTRIGKKSPIQLAVALASVATASAVVISSVYAKGGEVGAAAGGGGGGPAILVFPSRDFVNLTGYKPSDNVSVALYHNGKLVTTSNTVRPEVDAKDAKTAALGGQVLVNHPAIGTQQACWAASPTSAFAGGAAAAAGANGSISTGDVVVVTVNGKRTQQTTVRDVTISAPVQRGGHTVVVHGHAAANRDGSGRLPLANVDVRLVAKKQAFAINGRRDIRASKGAGFSLDWDNPNNPNDSAFTAVFDLSTSIDPSGDVQKALDSQARVSWVDVPGSPTETTIFEVGGGVTTGPQAPCTAAGGPLS